MIARFLAYFLFAVAAFLGVLMLTILAQDPVVAFSTGIGGIIVAVGSVMCLAIGLVAKILYDSSVANEQARRDYSAARIYQAIMSDKHVEPFALYLRPFFTTGKVFNPKSHGLRDAIVPFSAFIPFSLFEQDRITYEYTLARSLEAGKFPLIALGQPGSEIGSGLLPVDDESWTKVVQKLVADAKLIFVMPGYQDGTKWEINLIIQRHLLYKTIFVVPPKREIISSGTGHVFSFEEFWKQSKKSLATIGLTDMLELGSTMHHPTLSEEAGAMFTLDEDRRVEAMRGISSHTPHLTVLRHIKQLRPKLFHRSP